MGTGDISITLDPSVVIPARICLDMELEGSESFEMDLKGSLTRDMGWDALIKVALSNKRRLLVTWHKDRWAESIPHWRVQVDLQVQGDNLHDWSRFHRWTPYDLNNNWLATGNQIPLKVKTPDPNVWNVVTLHVSDYATPVWLSFIGMFGTEKLARSDQYRLRSESGRLTLELNTDGHVGNVFDLPSLISPTASINAIGDGDCHPTMNVLTIHRARKNVLYGEQSATSGSLVSTYLPDDTGGFKLVDGEEPKPGDFGYLHTFQRISNPTSGKDSEVEKLKELKESGAWEAFLQQSFETRADARQDQLEALVRPVPMYMGPIRIDVQ